MDAVQTFPEGTVRWKEIVGCNDAFRWHTCEPGEPFYSSALYLAEEYWDGKVWVDANDVGEDDAS